MQRLLAKASEGRGRWITRGVLGLCAIALALFVRDQIAGTEFRVVQAPQRIQLTEPLPEPEPEELPELEQPEPEESVEVEEAEAEEDMSADDLPPAGELLGLDSEGVAGSDAFGLAARKGGRDLLQTGSGGVGCEWYASVLNSELNELLLPILSGSERLLAEQWSVIVELWLEPDGDVQRYEVSSTGNEALDLEIESAMARFDRVETPPPADMPQPVRLRLRCHA